MDAIVWILTKTFIDNVDNGWYFVDVCAFATQPVYITESYCKDGGDSWD
jgi:hypothetical protein